MKTVKFYTLGCKVNQYDTQSIRERFAKMGFEELENGLPASLYVVNTCTVTQKADSDSLAFIRRAKRENPRAKIIVTGCLAELDRNKIMSIGKDILVIGNNDKNRILSKLSSLFRFPNDERLTTNDGISYFRGHTRAFLKIQDGCDNFCSYCKVPLARGKPESKPLKQIIREAESLAKNGYKEIVLSGICIGAYGDLPSVITELEKIEGLSRIRLSSIEAGDVSARLIKKMARSKKVCRHLHIPIQSGDDRILKKMNRKYSRNDYLRLIRRIKKMIPGVSITTDVLVGFPGESEANFSNTLDLVKEIIPLKVHIFPYSPREGTAAYLLTDRVADAKIRDRVRRMRYAARKCALAHQRKFMNRTMDVLVEGRYRNNSGYWEGYTDNYLRVELKSNSNLANRIIPVKLKSIKGSSIIAKFTDER